MAKSLNKLDQFTCSNFDYLKSQQDFIKDASRKSSIDVHIRPLVEAINETDNYFTTSSCSGRFVVFSLNETSLKKDCVWLKVSHDPINETEIDELIKIVDENKTTCKQITLKFEPFILHVSCRSLLHAKKMMDQAIESGFRNSGISIGAGKIIIAVRSTQFLECPISRNGDLLVDEKYIRYICDLANEKFKDNFQRIEKFFTNVREKCLENEKEEKEDLQENDEKPKKKVYVKKSKASRIKPEKKNENTDINDEIDFNELFLN